MKAPPRAALRRVLPILCGPKAPGPSDIRNQSGQSLFGKTTRDDRRPFESGDYYEGANRPN
ncbi:hypothetical protein LZK73_24455 (plasmid) [Neorhizobium galegae]|nr:hypothetical protein LZK73_24455 [Neorhizobium galegae]